MSFRSPLSYKGVSAPTPPNQIISDREPTANDFQSFNIGDRWVVPTQSSGPSEQEWVLMSKAQNQAVWVQVNAGGAVTYNDHELLVGTGTSAIDTIGTGTTGQALVSGGASADPVFNTLGVVGGGTAKTSFTTYTPICGGTTATGSLQSVASIGTSGQVLTSHGAGMLPTFEDAIFTPPITVPDGGTGDTSVPAFEVVCGGVTDVDALQTVGSLGTLNQVLSSNGAAALPSWKDLPTPPVPAEVLLLTLTASGNTTFTFDSTYVNGDYPIYKFRWNDLTQTNSSMAFQLSADNGGSYINTGYQSSVMVNPVGGNTWANTNSTTLGLCAGNFGVSSGQMEIYGTQVVSLTTWCGQSVAANGQAAIIQGNNTTITTVNNIQFFISAGGGATFTTGAISLYGISQ